MEEIKKYIGNYYIFRYKSILMSGYFCGIGEIDNKYGMIFIDVVAAGATMTNNIAMVVSPKNIKCTLYSKMIDLRKKCRELFKSKKLNETGDIYYPINKIEEVTC